MEKDRFITAADCIMTIAVRSCFVQLHKKTQYVHKKDTKNDTD